MRSAMRTTRPNRPPETTNKNMTEKANAKEVAANGACPVCGKSINSKQAWYGHKSAHSDAEIKSVIVGDCDPDTSGSQDDDTLTIPKRGWFEDHHEAVIMSIKPNNVENWQTPAEKAAKAYLQEHGAKTNDYCRAFDECEKGDCDMGANGYEATYCIKHQDPDPDAEPSGSGITREEVEEIAGRAAGEAVKAVLAESDLDL